MEYIQYDYVTLANNFIDKISDKKLLAKKFRTVTGYDAPIPLLRAMYDRIIETKRPMNAELEHVVKYYKM